MRCSVSTSIGVMAGVPIEGAFPQIPEDKSVGNRVSKEVAKITGVVAKFRCLLLLRWPPFSRTFPSAATGKPEAAREGRRFGNETPHLRNWNGASAPDRGLRSLGTEDRPAVERRAGTLEPLRRGGGPIGTSAGNGRGSPRGLGTDASAEGPSRWSSSEDGWHPSRPQGRIGATNASAGVAAGRPQGPKAAGWSKDRKAPDDGETRSRSGMTEVSAEV
jgi:hypothetical protein